MALFSKRKDNLIFKPRKTSKEKEISRLRKRKLFNQQFKGFYSRHRTKILIIPVILVILAVVLTVYGIFKTFIAVKITTIEVLGESDSINKKLVEELQSYKNKNLFEVSIGNLREDISKAYNLSGKQIKLFKIIPDKLRIEIVENSPKIAVINYLGISLIDNQGEFIKQLELKAIPLEKTEREFLSAPKNLDSEMVKKRYTENNSGTGSVVVKWEDVTVEEKDQIYNTLIEEFTQKQNEFYRLSIEEYLAGDFKNVPVVSAYFELFSSENFIDNDLIDLTLTYVEELKKLGLTAKTVIWPSIGSITIVSTSEKKFLFAEKRSLTDQLTDLKTVIYSGILDTGTIFDFRSNNFSIK